VNIPVDMLPAVRSREISMRMVDAEGHALGRRYYCPKHKKALRPDDIVRGYETDDGKIIVVTDEELDEIAPEMSREIELRRFVPLDQIEPKFFDHPYVLAPAGRSTKAYHLLARAIEGSGRVGIGTFVMRARQYLVAVLSDGVVLRAQTLRFADELRSPGAIGLAKAQRPKAAAARRLARLVDEQTQPELDEEELADRHAAKLQALAERKLREKRDVVDLGADAESEDDADHGDNVIDLMKILRERLGGARSDRSKPKRTPSRRPRGRKRAGKR
jgi:DNA end-binding protein Ku